MVNMHFTLLTFFALFTAKFATIQAHWGVFYYLFSKKMCSLSWRINAHSYETCIQNVLQYD